MNSIIINSTPLTLRNPLLNHKNLLTRPFRESITVIAVPSNDKEQGFKRPYRYYDLLSLSFHDIPLKKAGFPDMYYVKEPLHRLYRFLYRY